MIVIGYHKPKDYLILVFRQWLAFSTILLIPHKYHENRDCSFLRNCTHTYAEYYKTNFRKSGQHVQV